MVLCLFQTLLTSFIESKPCHVTNINVYGGNVQIGDGGTLHVSSES